MAQEKYYVWAAGTEQGPWTEDELRKQLQSGAVAYTDFVWEAAENAWQMLALHYYDEFQAPTKPPKAVLEAAVDQAVDEEAKVATLPTKPADLKKYAKQSFDQQFGVSNEAIWFLYKDQEKYGPYRFLEVVQLLQAKKCEPTDFIWKPGFGDWERIKAVPEFDSGILERLANVTSFSGINLDTVFIKRAFPRVPYDSEVILHDDQQLMIGEATTISEGGAFVKVAAPGHERGDRLKLHFSASGVPVPFNCIAEVTQVCKTDPVGYCLKFIYLEQEDQERIKQFAKQRVKGGQAKQSA